MCPYRSSWLVAFPRCKPAHPHEPGLACAFPFFDPNEEGQEENVQGLVEDRLRKTEKQHDTTATFKRRVHAICKQYPGGAKLVPGLARRMTLCIQRRVAPSGERVRVFMF